MDIVYKFCVETFSVLLDIFFGMELLGNVLIMFNFFRNTGFFFLRNKKMNVRKSGVIELFHVLVVLVIM